MLKFVISLKANNATAKITNKRI